jgi:thioesterase domain-containing protein
LTDYIRRFVEVCRAHVQAIMGYAPPPLAQPLYFFRPADSGVLAEVAGERLDDDLGWGKVTPSVVLHQVPGDHFSMLVGENANCLAERLAVCLD